MTRNRPRALRHGAGSWRVDMPLCERTRGHARALLAQSGGEAQGARRVGPLLGVCIETGFDVTSEFPVPYNSKTTGRSSDPPASKSTRNGTPIDSVHHYVNHSRAHKIEPGIRRWYAEAFVGVSVLYQLQLPDTNTKYEYRLLCSVIKLYLVLVSSFE